MKDLDDGFMLIAHPYPQIEGEMLLVQLLADENVESPGTGEKVEEEKQVEEEKSKKKKLTDDDDIVLKDFSLRKRHFTMAKAKSGSKSALAKK